MAMHQSTKRKMQVPVSKEESLREAGCWNLYLHKLADIAIQEVKKTNNANIERKQNVSVSGVKSGDAGGLNRGLHLNADMAIQEVKETSKAIKERKMQVSVSEEESGDAGGSNHCLRLLVDLAIQELKKTSKGNTERKMETPVSAEESGDADDLNRGLHLLADMAVKQMNMASKASKGIKRKVPISMEESGDAGCLNVNPTKDAMKRVMKAKEQRKKGIAQPRLSSAANSALRSLSRNRASSSTGPAVKDSESLPVQVSPNALPKSLGINFYKRIGRWTAYIWVKNQAESKGKGKQIYIGSYASGSEAMRAYDKASLKHFGKDAKLNKRREDYLQDLDVMDRFTNANYILFLRRSSRNSKSVKVVQGITKCPEGLFEVKVRDQDPPRKWQYFGTFDSLEEAKRCYMRAVFLRISK